MVKPNRMPDNPRFHPYASIVPLMSDDEYAELIASVGKDGLALPVTVYQGKILDGRNRWYACQELGVEHREVQFKGDNEAALRFVWDANVVRRMLTTGQRAMAAERLANLKRGGQENNTNAKIQNEKVARPHRSESDHQGITKAAQASGVSPKSIKRARVVRQQGVPELAEAVERGRITVGTAERIAKLPPETQGTLAKLPQAEVTRQLPPTGRTHTHLAAVPDWTPPPLDKPMRKAPKKPQVTVLTNIISHIEAAGVALDEITELDDTTDIVFLRQWRRELDKAVPQIQKFRRLLTESLKGK